MTGRRLAVAAAAISAAAVVLAVLVAWVVLRWHRRKRDALDAIEAFEAFDEVQVQDEDLLTDAAKTLLGYSCVISPYASGENKVTFGEILRRNPLDPGGSTCLIAGSGFGLLKGAATCEPAPDLAGMTSGGDFAERAYSWTNPLTDGTLTALGASFRTTSDLETLRLHSGVPGCVIDLGSVSTAEALSSIDKTLTQRAAALASGTYYSSVVMAGMQDALLHQHQQNQQNPTVGGGMPQQQQKNAAAQQNAQQQNDLDLKRLKAASVAQCPTGQPCGTSGSVVQRQTNSNVCVTSKTTDASSTTTASPCGANYAPQLWTLTSTSQLLLSASSNLPEPSCLAVTPSKAPGDPDVVSKAPCDPTDEKQRWTLPRTTRDEHRPRTGTITNASSCLDSAGESLVVRPCVSTISTQQWTFSAQTASGPYSSSTDAKQRVVGRLSTPQGRCVEAEADPAGDTAWGTDPATGQPYRYRLSPSSAADGCNDRREQLFAVNGNGTLESVAFPGQCVAFDAKSWQLGWGVRLASCDRSPKPADAQAFAFPKGKPAGPLSTRNGSAGKQACISLDAVKNEVVGAACAKGRNDDAALSFQGITAHPLPLRHYIFLSRVRSEDMFMFSSSAGGAAGPRKKKKAAAKKKKVAAPKKKMATKTMLMRGGSDCAVSSYFQPTTQSSQWVSGLPFADSGDGSGNNNAVLSAYGSGESVVPYRQDVVMYDGSGMSAPMGTPFSTGSPWTGGGGRTVKPKRTRAKKATTKQAKKKTATKRT